MKHKTHKHVIIGLFVFVTIGYFAVQSAVSQLYERYNAQKSTIIEDRNGLEIAILPNEKGHYMRPVEIVPPEFAQLLIAKEDNYFYYHIGVNPGSIARSLLYYPFRGRFSGSSTLTQQLVKNLLDNENKRTFKNKIKDSRK